MHFSEDDIHLCF